MRIPRTASSRPRRRAAGVVLSVLVTTGLITCAGGAAGSGSGVAANDAGVLPRPGAPTKSIAFYVGKNLTEDGETLLGGFGHEPSSHWLEIVPSREFPEDATSTVGVTDRAEYPGELTEIPQARRTAKYISSNYSEFSGFPAPLTNGGLNEHGVAARDVWSPTSDRLLDKTDARQTGPNYSDLSRIAMERATSAREAVEIVGGLIDKYGYSTYGGNSHLFADENEGWVLVNYGGSQGLWAAERLGPDEARVSYPGYLDPLPLDYKKRPGEFLASDHFIDYAVEQGWFDPADSDAFDPQAIYGGWQPGEREVTPTHPWGANVQGALERELAEELAPVSLEDMLAYVRDPRWSHDRSGYGQVAQLSDVDNKNLNALWTAVTGAVTTPYVPVYIGAEDVPPEFKQHRYLTNETASTHVAADYAPLEATEYATRTFKRLMYHTCERPEEFYEPVTAEIEEFERGLLSEQEGVVAKAARHYAAGREAAAAEYLTGYVGDRLGQSLQLGDRLVDAVESETRERFGIRMPSGRELQGETARPESQSMNRGGDLDGDADGIAYCYREGLGDFPREHGSYDGRAGELELSVSQLSKKEFFRAMEQAAPGNGNGWRTRAERAWAQLQNAGE